MTVEETVCGILEKHVGPECRPVRLDQRLREELLITSLTMMLIVLELEQALGRELSAGKLARVVTVEDLVQALCADRP